MLTPEFFGGQLLKLAAYGHEGVDEFQLRAKSRGTAVALCLPTYKVVEDSL